MKGKLIGVIIVTIGFIIYGIGVFTHKNHMIYSSHFGLFTSILAFYGFFYYIVNISDLIKGKEELDKTIKK